jgi:DNA polymerase
MFSQNDIFIDFETRSRVDIKKTGSWVYAADPSTDVLCMALAINNGPIEIIPFVIGDFDCYLEKDLEKFRKLCEDESNKFIAHNATFEQNIYANIFVKRFGFPELPPHRWHCTMAQCLIHSVPAALKKAGSFLNLEEQKDMLGNTTMLQLSKPDKNNKWIFDFEKYKTMYEYCKQDVGVTRIIFNYLPKISPEEKRVWNLDQKINNNGFKCDLDLIKKSIFVISRFEEQINADLKKLTDGMIESFSCLSNFKKYFTEKLNFPITELNKGAVKKLLNNPLVPEKGKQILNLRLAVGKTSVKKYVMFDGASDENGIMRNTLQYHVATTGRWGGRLVQVQNLPRGNFKISEEAIQEFKNLSYEELFEKYQYDLLEFMASNLRGCIVARERKCLIWSDYNAIETRVLAWFAGENKLLNSYKNNQDVYCDMASAIYGRKITKENKAERQMGKQAILGCGYGMGGKKFAMTCTTYDMDVSEEFGQRVVTTYRSMYPNIPRCWNQVNADLKACVCNKEIIVREKYAMAVQNDFLFIRLPSGRCLAYYKPSFAGNGEVQYQGVNSQTKKEENVKIYGGKIVENIVQAIARDILANAMLNIDSETCFDVIISVHDEIIAEFPSDTMVRAETYKDAFEKCMLNQPVWAENIPLAVETTIKRRYEK